MHVFIGVVDAIHEFMTPLESKERRLIQLAP